MPTNPFEVLDDYAHKVVEEPKVTIGFAFETKIGHMQDKFWFGVYCRMMGVRLSIGTNRVIVMP